MRTSIISQRFFCETACSLYGKEEKNYWKRSWLGKRGATVICAWREGNQCLRHCPRAMVERFTFLQSLKIWGSQLPFAAVVETVLIDISLCRERLSLVSWSLELGSFVFMRLRCPQGNLLGSSCSIPQWLWQFECPRRPLALRKRIALLDLPWWYAISST